MKTTGISPAPADGLCPNCGSNEWQLVEQIQQWRHGRYVPGEGFLFEGNHEWGQVSAEGDPLFLECRSCLTPFQVPEYRWEVATA